MAITYNGREYVSHEKYPETDGYRAYDNEVRHTGRVLETFYRSEWIMLNIWEVAHYARVWTGARVIDVFLGYDDGYTRDLTRVCEVDADPVIRERAAAWTEGNNRGKALARGMVSYDRYQEEIQRAKDDPAVKGRVVEVYKGRKVPRGTRGRVFWIGGDNYGRTKLGISPSGNMVGGKYVDAVWVAADNCQPVCRNDGKHIW